MKPTRSTRSPTQHGRRALSRERHRAGDRRLPERARGSHPSSGALNLALLCQAERLQNSGSRRIARCSPWSRAARRWNGIGLILGELKKFEDARNASLGRSRRSRSTPSALNLSFTLSNLATSTARCARRSGPRARPVLRRAEVRARDDLEYEAPDLSIVPELGGERRPTPPVENSPRRAPLDSLFTELTPAAPARTEPAAAPLREGRTTSRRVSTTARRRSQSRAHPGGSRAVGMTLSGRFARQGLTARRSTLPRRAAATTAGTQGDARRAPALLMLGRGRGPATRRAPARRGRIRRDDVLAPPPARTPAIRRGARGARARPALRADASDVMQKIGDIARSLGDNEGAITAYRHALALETASRTSASSSRAARRPGQLKEADQELTRRSMRSPTSSRRRSSSRR